MGQELSQLKQSTKPDHVILSQAMEKIAEVESVAVKHEKGLAKSKSAYSHFADYSMFPDRFNEKTTVVLQQTPIEIESGQIGNNSDHHQHQHNGSDDHFSDYSLYPDKYDQCRLKRSVSTAPSEPGTSLPASSATSGFLSKYSARLRSSSVSESEHGNDNISPSSSGGGDQPRPRSLSNSKMYYFDFTMIPDKGNFIYEERKRHRQPSPGITGNHSDGINKQDYLKVPQVIPEGSSVPSSFLPAPSSMEDIAQKVKRSRQASEPRDRFGFFDFSNFPDKDPKCFNKKQD